MTANDFSVRRMLASLLAMTLVAATVALVAIPPETAQAAGGVWVGDGGVLLGGPPFSPEWDASDFTTAGGQLDYTTEANPGTGSLGGTITSSVTYGAMPAQIEPGQTYNVTMTAQGVGFVGDPSTLLQVNASLYLETLFLANAIINWNCGPCDTPGLQSASSAINLSAGSTPGETTDFNFRVGNCGDACKVVYTYTWTIPATCDGLPVTIDMNLGASGVGTTGDDVILGTPTADTIIARGGDDTICAGAGDDTIVGGAGDDKIFGEGGADDIAGRGGSDAIFGGPGADIITGGGGTDGIAGEGGNDDIGGGGAPDIVFGGPGDDIIAGQNGADYIDGQGGHDNITGQTGPDELLGGPLDDILIGGNGNDTLYGGSGFDRCSGNSGPADMAEAATCEQTPGVEVLF